jgi:hypothetical protein
VKPIAGTVQSAFSGTFAKSGLEVRSPEAAAGDLLKTIDDLTVEKNGKFVSYSGDVIPW